MKWWLIAPVVLIACCAYILVRLGSFLARRRADSGRHLAFTYGIASNQRAVDDRR